MRWAALLLSLTACEGLFEPKPTHDEMCIDFGYQPESTEYSQCRLTLHQEDEARRRAALQAWAIIQQNQQRYYQPPVTTQCQWIGSFLNCTTQ